MGQKVNPIGLRLGINRTWDSRWFAIRGEYAQLLHEDLKIRKHILKTRKQAGISQGRHRAPAQEVPRHDPHRASRRPDRQEGRGHREAPQGACDDDRLRRAPEHRRSAQAGDRRHAGGREHRPAARAPRGFPPRHEAGGAVGDASGRARASASIAAAVSAARKSRAWSGIARAACRCTRCAPTSTTAWRLAARLTASCGIKVWIFKGEILEHDPMAQDKALEAQDRRHAPPGAAMTPRRRMS